LAWQPQRTLHITAALLLTVASSYTVLSVKKKTKRRKRKREEKERETFSLFVFRTQRHNTLQNPL